MEVKTQVQETSPATEPHIQTACDIATGKTQSDPSEQGTSILGAKKDLNSKGRGDHWYRMVYRNGSWQYVSTDRLPSGQFLASDRKATVHGDVYIGEIVVQHDRGGPVDTAWIITAPDPTTKAVKVDVTFTKRRDGNVGITLPDGSKLVLSNPRPK